MTELIPMEDNDPEPSKDYSYMVIATDGAGDGWVLDAAPGFSDQMLLDSMPGYCIDNSIYVPNDVLPNSLYFVTNIKISSGQDSHDPYEYYMEIAGDWSLVATADVAKRKEMYDV